MISYAQTKIPPRYEILYQDGEKFHRLVAEYGEDEAIARHLDEFEFTEEACTLLTLRKKVAQLQSAGKSVVCIHERINILAEEEEDGERFWSWEDMKEIYL